MAFKTFTNGSVLTDSDLNDYLMKQAVIVCTSGTRPSSPNEGMTIYETDTNRHVKYTGSAWEIMGSTRVEGQTPSIVADTTSPTLGTGAVRNGHYTYTSGPSLIYSFFIKFGTSGTNAGSGNYSITLPVTGALPFGSSAHPAVGSILLADASSGLFATGSCFVSSADPTKLALISSSGIVTNAVPWAWSTNDYVSGSITYPL